MSVNSSESADAICNRRCSQSSQEVQKKLNEVVSSTKGHLYSEPKRETPDTDFRPHDDAIARVMYVEQSLMHANKLVSQTQVRGSCAVSITSTFFLSFFIVIDFTAV